MSFRLPFWIVDCVPCCWACCTCRCCCCCCWLRMCNESALWCCVNARCWANCLRGSSHCVVRVLWLRNKEKIKGKKNYNFFIRLFRPQKCDDNENSWRISFFIRFFAEWTKFLFSFQYFRLACIHIHHVFVHMTDISSRYFCVSAESNRNSFRCNAWIHVVQ